MLGPEIWKDFDGTPLKFQNGVRVKVKRPPENPGRIDGWVRGYDLCTGNKPAYEVYFMGDPMQLIGESFLERQPDYMQNDHKHHPSRICGICGFVSS